MTFANLVIILNFIIFIITCSNTCMTLCKNRKTRSELKLKDELKIKKQNTVNALFDLHKEQINDFKTLEIFKDQVNDNDIKPNINNIKSATIKKNKNEIDHIKDKINNQCKILLPNNIKKFKCFSNNKIFNKRMDKFLKKFNNLFKSDKDLDISSNIINNKLSDYLIKKKNMKY